MAKIDDMEPHTGRYLAENGEIGEVINMVDALLGRLGFPNIIKAQVSDEFDRKQTISGNGEAIIATIIDDISVNFQYGVSTNDIKNGGDVTGGGSIGQVGSMATVNIDTAVGTATLESIDAIRYVAGHEVRGILTTIFSTPEDGVNQYAGFLNSSDGFSVGYQGLNFGLWFVEGGNFNFINRDNFNFDILDGTGPSGYNINPQKGQFYRLSYTWHGFGPLRFEVMDLGTRSFIPVHVVDFINTADETHLENPNLPISVKIERTSGTGNAGIIKTGSWRAGNVGTDRETSPADRWFAFFRLDATVLATAPNGTHLITLRSKASYSGKTNHIKTVVKILVAISAHNKDLVVAAIPTAILRAADATFASNIDAGFADIDTLNSVMEQSKVASAVDLTTITEDDYADVAVIKGSSERGNTDVQGFDINPSDEISFIVIPPGSGTGTISLQGNFKELH